MQEDIFKSKYIGVYKKGRGIKSWFTDIRFDNGYREIKVHSDTEEKAALKYNILSTFFQGKRSKLNDINCTDKEYREIAKELYNQLTLPSGVQKANSNQGCKKYPDASTEFVGVYKYPSKELYFAYITKNKKRYSLGYYKNKYIAAAAYNIAANYLYNKTTKLNNVEMNIVDDFFTIRILRKLEEYEG